MKKLIWTISFLLILISGSFGQKTTSFNYADYWSKIKQLFIERNQNEALKYVDSIYFHAKKENQHGHFLKAVIYQTYLTEYNEESSIQRKIDKLDIEIKNLKEPQAQILYSYKAEILWNYYQLNRYRILNRTSTINYKHEDISTWDLRTLEEEVSKSFLMSIKNDQLLKSTKLEGYEQIIDTNESSRKYRPTLYDLLIHRAIDFFMDDEPQIVKPAVTFYVNNPRYIDNAYDFTTTNITTPDSLSMKFYALQLLQEAMKFHLNDTNAEALIDVDLKRLEFVKKNAVFENSDSLYIESLKSLFNKYPDNSEVASVCYKLADYYNTEASNYDSLTNPKPHLYYMEALKYIDYANNKFPNTIGAINCKIVKSKIIVSDLTTTAEDYTMVETPFKILVKSRNIKTIYLRVIPISGSKYDSLIDYKHEDSLFQNVTKLKYKTQSKIILPFQNDYQERSMEIIIDPLPKGEYIILGSDNENFDSLEHPICFSKIKVTNLSFTKRLLDDGAYEITVLNRKTGLPIKNAKVTIQMREHYTWENKGKQIIKKTTDKNGHCVFHTQNKDERYYTDCSISTTDDQIKIKERIFRNYKPFDFSASTRAFIFTDRSIYRPGQTIYFKGILVEKIGLKSKIVVGKKTKILIENGSKEILSIDVETNEFGSFSGSFVAPIGFTGSLSFDMKDVYGYQSIQVEEYKRPKFEGTFNPIIGSFRLNDKISVTGVAKAFAGNVINGAKVKYRIRRNVYSHWREWDYNDNGYDTEIDYGNTTTNEKGEFTILFDAIPDNDIKKESKPIFYYTITADITDINGETHTTSTSIPVGYKTLNVHFSVPRDLDQSLNKYNFDIRTTNFNNQHEPALLSVKVFRLEQPQKIFIERYWERPTSYLYSKEEFSSLLPNDEYSLELDKTSWKRKEIIFQKLINTETDSIIAFENLMKWERGEYIIEIEGKDKHGEGFIKSQYFSLVNSSITDNSKYTHLSIRTNKGLIEQPNSLNITLESSHKNANVYIEIYEKTILKHRQWVNLNKNSKSINIRIPKNNGTISYKAFLAIDNRFYFNEGVLLNAKNECLDIKFATFRNKLNPGQEEEWQMTIKGRDGGKVAAELMMSMYDASLDALNPHSWEFDLNGQEEDVFYKLMINRWHLNTFNNFEQYSYYRKNIIVRNDETIKHIYYEQLFPNRFFISPYYNFEGEPQIVACRTTAGVATTAAGVQSDDGLNFGNVEEIFDLTSSKNSDNSINNQNQQLKPLIIRKNFNETAFFMPQLATDAEGNIVIKFKVPESLTRWKIMGLAHTKDLRIGEFTRELVTQKELMVVPNQPRFFREGDNMEFNAKISNISDKDLNGIAKIEFFDALTMKPINSELGLTTVEIPFSTLKGQSTSVAWKIAIPQGLMAITYRVTAQSGNFSDGEEMTLPVLTNRMLVTESLPLPINGNQTKTFSFDKLKNNTSTTLKNFKYTLEFTSNPAWYAIQALPYLMEYPYECSEQTFNRFYANSIATHITNSSPKIKAVFESWKINSPEALMSNLEKNQELKSLMLEETPWMLDAKNETEQKKRIGLLFDIINMSNQLNSTFQKLAKMQTSNGSWSWFPGMLGNEYITQYILAGFGHLKNMGIDIYSTNSYIKKMLINAVFYTDEQINKNYEKQIMQNSEISLNFNSMNEIQYLYARTFFIDSIDITKKNRKAFDYYMNKNKLAWQNKNIYMQAMIAIVNFKTGDLETAKKIMASIKDRAIYSEEMGMYWRNEGSGYFWYEAPIERQALLIEAFDLITNDQESVEKMKIWLLKQKQTQNWGTTKSTAEACYALLLKGTSQLADDQLVEIKIGDKVIDPKKMDNLKVEAGTGYFKTAWNGTEITPNMDNITVTKSTAGVAWGSVYWQYFENLDKITPAATPLSMKKELFIVRATPTGEVIEPVKAGDKIKVGDKIRVRIVLRSDRDMEYVHMKDMRAAAFEPINVLSQYKYQDGLGYYESTRDAATNFFFDYLRKGTYVFEYTLFATQKGDFSNGITTIQCMYAPEFTSHSEGVRVVVE